MRNTLNYFKEHLYLFGRDLYYASKRILLSNEKLQKISLKFKTPYKYSHFI